MHLFFAATTISASNPIKYLEFTSPFDYGYSQHIQETYNNELITDTVTLPENIIALHTRLELASSYHPRKTNHTDVVLGNDSYLCVLHPYYPTSEH